MANQVAILAALKLLVDSGKAIVAEIKPGQSIADRAADLQPLVGDALALFPVGADLPAELKSVQASDLPALASVLVADLDLGDKHAQDIAQAGIQVLSDAANKVVPDVLALIHAIAGQPAQAPAPAAAPAPAPAPSAS